MANPEHLRILQGGTAQWNQWRKEKPKINPQLDSLDLTWVTLVRANLRKVNLTNSTLLGSDLRSSDLTEANLVSTNLRGANLRRVNLDHASMTNSILSEANLYEANMRGVNLADGELEKANLTGADLRRANLSDANLRSANLTDADLVGARLAGADVAGASIGWTTFGDVDLSGVKNLTTVKHRGPSSIGVETVYASKGQIPEIFLRGAGLPESFITFVNSLISAPIAFYSCFISYSTQDQEFADRLYADLQAKGVRCWFAPHDVRGGRKLDEQIDEAIRVYDRLLLILSEHSMNSEWVKTEIANARQREVREKRQMLFPISLAPFEKIKEWRAFDADTGKDSAREIREYFIPDFSNWKDQDSYRKAFERLLRDLKADRAEAEEV